MGIYAGDAGPLRSLRLKWASDYGCLSAGEGNDAAAHSIICALCARSSQRTRRQCGDCCVSSHARSVPTSLRMETDSHCGPPRRSRGRRIKRPSMNQSASVSPQRSSKHLAVCSNLAPLRAPARASLKPDGDPCRSGQRVRVRRLGLVGVSARRHAAQYHFVSS